MRIRLLLIVGTAAALAVGGSAFLAGVQITRQADRLDAAQMRVQGAARDASALLALGQDYLLHHSMRAARQWHLYHDALAQALEPMAGVPDEDTVILANLRGTHAELARTFARLEAAPLGPQGSLEFEQREMLADHLVANTQRIADGVYQVADDLTRQRRDNETHRRQLVRAAGAALMMMMLGLALLITQRVLRPMRALRRAALAVREGDLQARCATRGHDEFGDLARDFNAMTEALQSRSERLRDNERSLRESLAWNRALLDSAGLAIVATRADGIIHSANPAALRMLGYTEDELVGRCTPERFHDPAELAQCAAELAAERGRPVSPLQALGDKAWHGQADEREWTYVRKDGSRLPVSLSLTAVRDGSGTVTGYLGLATDITERKRAEATIRHLAQHDSLTGLPNRALLGDRLGVALRRAQRHGERVAVMMLDLDHFKQINDTLGHPAGDRLLQAVAQRLLAAVRPSDTVARLGGDEFVVLLDGIQGNADIDRIAASILARMAEPVPEGAHALRVTTSVGVAIYPDDALDAEVLMEHADAAMYQAKAAGRNGYRVYGAPEVVDAA